jgi:hypothetical protein
MYSARLGVLVISIAGLPVFAPSALAEIDRWVDERGVIHYSNMPPQRETRRFAGDAVAVAPKVAARAIASLPVSAPAAGATNQVLPGSPSWIDRATADSVASRLLHAPRMLMGSNSR